MNQSFQRKIEDFICEHCGKAVAGNGYTNHCPYCLWSKHVDIFPGDRANECQGSMAPVGGFWKSGEWRIVHQCLICQEKKVNKLDQKDDLRILEKIVRETDPME